MSMREVAEVLGRLEHPNGDLDPADVVEAARDPASPLHPFFEWNNDEAAEQWRIGQARLLIRRVKIQVTVHDVPMDVVRYVRNPDQAGAYSNIVRIRSDESRSRRTVLDEMSRVSQAAKRARAVAAVLGNVEQVDEIIRLAEMVVTRVQVTDPAAGAG